jgi:hypothetical protein
VRKDSERKKTKILKKKHLVPREGAGKLRVDASLEWKERKILNNETQIDEGSKRGPQVPRDCGDGPLAHTAPLGSVVTMATPQACTLDV